MYNYIPTKVTQNYPFCRLQSVVKTFGHSTLWTNQSKFNKSTQRVRKGYHITLGTSVINSPMSPSLPMLKKSCMTTHTHTCIERHRNTLFTNRDLLPLKSFTLMTLLSQDYYANCTRICIHFQILIHLNYAKLVFALHSRIRQWPIRQSLWHNYWRKSLDTDSLTKLFGILMGKTMTDTYGCISPIMINKISHIVHKNYWLTLLVWPNHLGS